ncbi:MAG: patatin-like phospholipase family protein [Solirubrobacterales bacterium]
MDGGGIRGIIPAIVLAEVERRSGRPVADSFDLIAGTSTGGILALALSMAGEDGRPAWSAEEMIALYEREGEHIFSRSVWDRIRSADGLLDEKYPPEGMAEAFRTYLGEAKLSEALTEVLVTAYEIEQRTTYFFKRAKARADDRDDFAIRDAARATSAAPTYFEPVRLERLGGRPDLSLVDGGVFANNPAMCAYAEALKGDDEEVLVLSLGTGELTRPLPYEQAKNWGLAEWAKPIIDVVFDGVSDATDHHLEQILGSDRYYRFQTSLDRARDDMDDTRPENIEALKQEADELLREQRRRFDELLAKLGP